MRHFARRSPGTAPAATPDLLVLAPTRLEAWAARRAVPSKTRVIRCGVGGTAALPEFGTVVVCGLAGSLTERLRPGSVVIPGSVALASGESFSCDPILQAAFARASTDLGVVPSSEPLITLASMATGSARNVWGERGFVAVDMESALFAAAGRRLGVVRVVLDAPMAEIAPEWMSPLLVLRRPRLWPQGLRLAWQAPRYALRAARIVSRGLAGIA